MAGNGDSRIREKGDLSYVGNTVYGCDGTGQTIVVAAGPTKARFEV